MKSNAKTAIGALDSLSLVHLRATAKAAGIKTGKTRKATTENMLAAIAAGGLHYKSDFTLSVNPAKQGEPTQRVTYYAATLRTYKSGPGAENQVWITPDMAKKGSPMAPA